MPLIAKLIEYIVQYLVDIILGMIITMNNEPPKEHRLHREVRALNRTLVFLVLVITVLLVLASAGCATARKALLVQNADGTYTEKPIVAEVQTAIQQTGNSLAPVTGGLSSIVGYALAGVFGVFVTLLKRNSQITALKNGIDTVNTALLSSPNADQLISRIVERAKVDDTTSVIDKHIG